jgi:heme-degrading monooxygenase HmoA
MMLPKLVPALALAMGMLIATPAAAGPVAVLVAVPVPPGLPRAQLEAAFVGSMGDYKGKPGLIRKYYTIGDDGRAGGIYLWESRAAAEAWYNDAWKAGVLKRWGSPASVTYFDVPAIVDNAK